MCSVQDGDFPERKTESKHTEGKLCIKCKEQQAVLITRVNDAFCRDCFQVYATHKFRAAIGKTKLVRDGELILVAYSGGPSSSALVNLIQEGLSQRAHKKLRFKPGFIFIDEGATVGSSAAERLSVCEKVQDILQSTGSPFYIKSLEEGLDLRESPTDMTGNQSTINTNQSSHQPPEVGEPFLPDGDCRSVYSAGTASVTLPDMSPSTSPTFRRDDLSSQGSTRVDGTESVCQSYDEAEQKLQQILSKLKTVSAKEDFIRSLRQKIILDVARHCGYTKLMLGSSGTQLAVRLLTDISTGRGAHAAMETAFADRRQEDMLMLRPLRDFSSKEIAVYNNIHGVETVFIPTLTTKGDTGVSIEHLTESFVTGLQVEYPSTVSNIMRTGEKLDSSTEKKIDRFCAMCQGPLDTSVGASSALSAVEFSRKISQNRKEQNKENVDSASSQCCGEGDGSCQTSVKNMPSPEEVLANLCYGCRLIVRDMDDIFHLPPYVLKDVAWRKRRSKMMSEIEGFLIQEN